MKNLIPLFIFFLSSFALDAQSAEPERTDTLCIRDVCSYCDVNDYAYKTHPFSKYYYCLCMFELKLNMNNWYVIQAKHASTVKVLFIENPSKFIDHVGWKEFKQLEVVELWGNDFDILMGFDDKMLSLPSLKTVKISMINMELSVWDGYKARYPNVKFEILN